MHRNKCATLQGMSNDVLPNSSRYYTVLLYANDEQVLMMYARGRSYTKFGNLMTQPTLLHPTSKWGRNAQFSLNSLPNDFIFQTMDPQLSSFNSF